MTDPGLWALHDPKAHHRDRQGGWPTCDRCIAQTVAFHDRMGIGHLIPPALRYRLEELAEKKTP